MTQALDDASSTRQLRYLMMQFLVNASFEHPIWSRSLLYWRTLMQRAMGSGRRHLADCSVCRDVDVAAMLPIALSLAVFDGWLKPLLVFLLVACLELMLSPT